MCRRQWANWREHASIHYTFFYKRQVFETLFTSSFLFTFSFPFTLSFPFTSSFCSLCSFWRTNCQFKAFNGWSGDPLHWISGGAFHFWEVASALWSEILKTVSHKMATAQWCWIFSKWSVHKWANKWPLLNNAVFSILDYTILLKSISARC